MPGKENPFLKSKRLAFSCVNSEQGIDSIVAHFVWVVFKHYSVEELICWCHV